MKGREREGGKPEVEHLSHFCIFTGVRQTETDAWQREAQTEQKGKKTEERLRELIEEENL